MCVSLAVTTDIHHQQTNKQRVTVNEHTHTHPVNNSNALETVRATDTRTATKHFSHSRQAVAILLLLGVLD